MRDRRRPRARAAALVDRLGAAYRSSRARRRMSIPELRWCRRGGAARRRAASACARRSPRWRATSRCGRSPCMRSRAARSAADDLHDRAACGAHARAGEPDRAQPTTARGRARRRSSAIKLSMSEIAIRCGRVKRDRRGNESGETSWLARRARAAAGGRAEHAHAVDPQRRARADRPPRPGRQPARGRARDERRAPVGADPRGGGRPAPRSRDRRAARRGRLTASSSRAPPSTPGSWPARSAPKLAVLGRSDSPRGALAPAERDTPGRRRRRALGQALPAIVIGLAGA